MSDSQTLAAKLKDEGNALFVRKDYQAAHHKYTLALGSDQNSAVLYANRAACSSNLKKYGEAIEDATKATEIDATYAKGWARLAAAQSSVGRDHESAHSWQKALNALPDGNLSATEQKQKEQYQSELKTLENKQRKLNTPRVQRHVFTAKDEKTPWQRALLMQDEYLRTGEVSSSVMVVVGAYHDWMEGVELMKMQKKMGRMMTGSTGAIEFLTNAILRDDRIFDVRESNFLQTYNTQARIEAQMQVAWTEGGARHIISEAVKRQRLQGWDSARRAITTTIRTWIMRGFVESFSRHQAELGVDFVGRALEVLRWGVVAWKNVPQDDKGSIFCASFVRGVHGLYLKMYTTANAANSTVFPLTALLQEARDLLEACEDTSIDGPADPGFIMSFTTYPRGCAQSTIGHCHRQQALLIPPESENAKEKIIEHYHLAAVAYLGAAHAYPRDDEKHLWFMHCALIHYFLCGTPLDVTLHIMEDIRQKLPAMKKIWEYSVVLRHFSRVFETMSEVEHDCREGLAAGRLTLSAPYMPHDLIMQDLMPKAAFGPA